MDFPSRESWKDPDTKTDFSMQILADLWNIPAKIVPALLMEYQCTLPT
jgi:hypothetical protein